MSFIPNIQIKKADRAVCAVLPAFLGKKNMKKYGKIRLIF